MIYSMPMFFQFHMHIFLDIQSIIIGIILIAILLGFYSKVTFVFKYVFTAGSKSVLLYLLLS